MLTRLILFGSVLAVAGGVFAQTSATSPGPADWSEPFPPHRIMGNIYYVGSRGLASYLITTPAGHILINSDLKTSVPLIRENIKKLGFRSVT
jgi:metallo-beta-lactamase class B